MAKRTDRHFNVRVHVTRVEKEVDDYTGKTTERLSEEVISLVVRADTLNKAIDKATDHLYTEKEDEAVVSQDVPNGATLS